MTQNYLVNNLLSIEKKSQQTLISPGLFGNLQKQKLEGLNFKISCFTVIHLKNFESLVE